MEIPGIGTVTRDDDLDWLISEPISVPVLGGQACRIIVEGYEDDSAQEEFHRTIGNFLSAEPAVLKAAEPHIFRYYEDCKSVMASQVDDFVEIERAADVWNHVRLGNEPMVSRRPYGDKGMYVSLECGCDWEREHGLQIVFKDGLRVNKIGPYDGHLTNSDAYNNKRLEDVIYKSFT